MELKDFIITEARVLGFSKTGIASPEYNPTAHNHFLNWLDNGYHAGMNYLERAARLRFDPKIHLAEAKSVIVCAHNYYNNPANNPRKGYVSIHARGDDYHIVIRDKLNALCDSIKNKFGEFNFKIFVDSSPISEKSLAVMAGIGFIGRNGTVIIPKNNTNSAGPLGSFHFLSVIISDLNLQCDTEVEGTCGTCVRCIKACPTGAIIDGGKVDAGKCLSYHNTQNKGDIPEPVAQQMGNMIFGCDICQLVCPYNSKAIDTSETRLSARADLIGIELEKMANISKYNFDQKYSNTSIVDFGYKNIKRNVLLVSKNIAKNTDP